MRAFGRRRCDTDHFCFVKWRCSRPRMQERVEVSDGVGRLEFLCWWELVVRPRTLAVKKMEKDCTGVSELASSVSWPDPCLKTCIQARIGMCKRDQTVKGQNSFTFGIKREKRCPRLGRNRRVGHWIWTKVSLCFVQNLLADTDWCE